MDPVRKAKRKARRADRAAAERNAALGSPGVTVIRYGYAPRAECQNCDFSLRKHAQVNRRDNSVRTAAQQHVTETGHEVDVIIQDVTRYLPVTEPTHPAAPALPSA